MSATRNHTKHLVKMGNAYATSDLRFYLKRHGSGWVLFDRESSKPRLAVMSTKASALRISDSIIATTLAWDQTVSPSKVAE